MTKDIKPEEIADEALDQTQGGGTFVRNPGEAKAYLGGALGGEVDAKKGKISSTSHPSEI